MTEDLLEQDRPKHRTKRFFNFFLDALRGLRKFYSIQPRVEKAYSLISSLIKQRHSLANKGRMIPAFPSLSISRAEQKDKNLH